jgi:hypothetical protein
LKVKECLEDFESTIKYLNEMNSYSKVNQERQVRFKALRTAPYLGESAPLPIQPSQERSSTGLYLKNLNPNTPEDNDASDPVQEINNSSSESDDLEEDSSELPRLSEFSRFKKFMVSSAAFSTLREKLRLFTFPSFKSSLHSLVTKLFDSAQISEALVPRLRYFITEFEFISPESIQITYTDKSMSLSNKIKALVEDRTGQTWEWWPLQPRDLPLAPDYARIKWQCVSPIAN